MAEVIPFRGILYDTTKVKGEDVVAPPYDIITPEYKETLYGKSPYNIVRIDFGKDIGGDNESVNRYTRARGYLNSWLGEGILMARKNPGFYSYEIEYRIKSRSKTLRGFFGLVKLEDLGKGNIHPHECTHSKPKTDRLNLMRSCNANISPIFSLYNSPERGVSGVLEKVIKQARPYIEAKDPDGAVHRLWIIEEKKDIEAISDDLKGRAVFIADGHHRYETALEFQREKNAGRAAQGIEPWDYVLMFLANISDDGLTILPAHRLVRDIPEDASGILSKYFDIVALPPDADMEESISRHEHTIGFSCYGDKHRYVLKYRGGGLDDVHPALKVLDVSILHELIFKKLLKVTDITYEMNPKKTLARVDKGLCKAAFFLNPTRVEDVERVALSSVRMPPKSTYFYPKLLTGFVINKF